MYFLNGMYFSYNASTYPFHFYPHRCSGTPRCVRMPVSATRSAFLVGLIVNSAGMVALDGLSNSPLLANLYPCMVFFRTSW